MEENLVQFPKAIPLNEDTDDVEEMLEDLDPNEVYNNLTDIQKFLLPFLDSIIAMVGKKGSGKSTVAVALLKLLSEHFNLPALSDQPLRPDFGSYTSFDLRKFIKDLTTISSALSGDVEAQEAATEALTGKLNIPITGSVAFLDEFYKYVDAANRDKIARLLTHWISQIRHWKMLLIIATPDLRMIDNRVVRQIDWVGNAYIDRRRLKVIAVFQSTNSDDIIRINLDAKKYWAMFNSWNMFAMRRSQFKVGGDVE